jgi:hypothetical protein
VVRGAGEAMTIILPEGKWARTRYLIKLRARLLYTQIRGKIDYRFAFRQIAPDATDIKRVTIYDAEGKKHKFVTGKVKFEPFRIDTTTPIDPKDAIYLRINPVEPE